MSFARRTTAAVPARPRRPRHTFTLTENLEPRRLMAAITDDFNDGNDDGWTRYDPLAPLHDPPQPALYELVDGTYRISVPASPFPPGAGPARAGSFHDDATFTDFVASVDIVDWDPALDMAFGILARVETPGLGTTNGYALSYSTDGDLDISLVVGEAPDDLDPRAPVLLEEGRDYRLVFEGRGPVLTGKIYDLADLTTPVVTTRAVDATYEGGSIGVFTYSNTSDGTGPADTTFDNFYADVPGPTVAYWRFEERAAGEEFQPPLEEGGPDSGVAIDEAGDDDRLRTFSDQSNPVYSDSVPAAVVAATGAANLRSLDFTPNEDLYTAEAGDLNPHLFEQFTVEASFNVDGLDRYQVIVGKDGKPTDMPLAPLQLKVRDDNDLLQIEIIDDGGVARQVSSLAPIVAGRWYNAAAVSDGTTMSLYLDDTTDPAGYVLQGTVAVDGGVIPIDSTWSVGRGMYDGGVTDWTDGKIDEVRISDVALTPDQFLFASHGDPFHVTQVFVNGPGLTTGSSANAVAFRNLAGIDGTYGYPVPAGSNQIRSIPWISGVNEVAIRFNDDVSGQIDQGDLVVRGSATPTYATTSFRYDAPTRTAVWGLAAPVTNDRLRLVLDDAGIGGLDGEWFNPLPVTPAGDAYPSGDGVAGGDFNFRVNVLGGDATQDGVVNALDLSFIKQRLNRTATNPGSGGAVYSVFGDITADGTINALDLSAAKQRLNRRLPADEPAATALLFGRAPISA